ncbi:MAG TPA: response regulator [Gemmatimonadales bacterium]|nr:response regulator [Gemmatimonadales bacterium]
MSEPELPGPSPSDARGVILLADDEEAVRWLGRRFLEADGWAVLEARDGEEALEIIESHDGPLRLVVTDLNMPKVSGRELAEVLSIFRPGLPVLGITGFLSAVSHDRRLPILPKPFSPGSLLQAVRMACGMSVRLRRPPLENRRRARRLRELTPAGAQGGLLAAVRMLRMLESASRVDA